MKTRHASLAALLWLLVAPIVMAATPCPPALPFNTGAMPVQGGDPSGLLGWPLAVVGACPFDVIINSALASLSVTSTQDNGEVTIGGVLLPINVAMVNANGAGASVLVAAVPGKKIRVLAYYLTTDVAQGIQWQSNANILIVFVATPAFTAISYNPMPAYFIETNAGEALEANLGAGGSLRGSLAYVLH